MSDTIRVTWTDNADNEDGYRVYRSRDGGATWTQASGDLSAGTTSFDDTGLLDGEEYVHKVETFTEDASSESEATAPVTTDLPDEDQPVLGNGVEDEIAVDRESTVSDYGSVRVQIRETGQSPWDSSAAGWAEQVLDHATTSTTFGSREDGEEYEVRARTETEHVDGAWTTPVAIVAKFPGATGLSLTVDGPRQISGEFIDNSDNEDGYHVKRRDELDPARLTGFGSWRTIQTLDPDTTTFADATLDPNHDYEYRIEAFTEHSSATSGTTSATTDVEYGPYWTLELRRSDGEKLTIDGDDFVPPSPRFSRAPSRITPWSVEIPETRVLSEEDWVNTDAFLWFDNGNELVLRGELQKVTHPSTAAPMDASNTTTTLEGADVGYEFKHGGAHEPYVSEEAHIALEDYLNTHFSDWTVTVHEPTVQLIDEDKLIQSSATQSEWESLLGTPPADQPYEIANGSPQLLQSCWTTEGEAAAAGNGTPQSYSGASGGTSMTLPSEVGNYVEWTFSTEHEIDASDFEVQMRARSLGAGSSDPTYTISLDGTTLFGPGAAFVSGGSWFWNQFDDSYSNWNLSGTLSAGTHTLRVEVDSVPSDPDAYTIDVVAPYDARYNYTWDNDNDGSGGYLDGPELYPDAVGIEPPTFDETRNAPSASVTVVMDDTSGQQALAASNDGGSNYGISASNTQTLDGTFPVPGSLVRAKLTLSRYGSRTDATPQTGFQGQAVDSYEFRVDTNSLAVIDDRTYTGSHLENIQSLCDDAGMIWVTPYSETGKEIVAMKPGEASATLPDVEVLGGEDTIDLEQYYNQVTVFGAESGDGTPLDALAESQDEIQQYGRREAPAVYEPRLESKADVENQANQLLAEYIAEKDRKATRTIVPKSITPGYAYSVPGLDEEIVLREVRFEDSERGTLSFDDVDDVVAVLARQSREIKQTKDTF